MGYAIEVEKLVKVYPGGTRALDGVDLRVPEGVVFGLFGHNGAGKTTLLSILIGLITPTSGTARVLGFDAVRESVEIRRRTSVVPEGFGFYEDMTGLANLVYLARLEGMDKSEAERRAMEALETVGLSHAACMKVGEYSRGMKQRLCIAQALLKDADLYLMDEPTAGLDPEGTAEFRKLVRDMASEGKTVVISTHLLREVGEVCTHGAVIKKGKILAQGSLADITERIRRERGHEYLVTVAGDPAPLAAALKGREWVLEVERRPNGLRVLTRGEAAGDITDVAKRVGLTVLSVRVVPSDWNEVFEILHQMR